MGDQFSGPGTTTTGDIGTGTSTSTFNNTTTPTTLLGNVQGTKTLPANYFYVGKSIRIWVAGVYGTLNAAPGNFTVTFKIGTTTIVASAASALPTTAQTNSTFWISILCTCRTVGGTGTLFATGMAIFDTAALGATMIGISGTAATTFDTTAASQTIDVLGTFSTADNANTISGQVFSIESDG